MFLRTIYKYRLLMMSLLLALVVYASCGKDGGAPVKEGRAALRLRLSHVVGAAPLVLGSVTYYNELQEGYTVSAFKYYLSNITLYNTEGKAVSLPEQYFLVSEDSVASKQLLLNKLPAGAYTRLSFRIGVDSARNNSGAQTGALDPVYGMFWTWNSGYIMAKMEGHSPVSAQPQQLLQFHVGGYAGAQNVARTVELPVEGLLLSDDAIAEVSVVADLGMWFSGPDPVSFKTLASWMTPGPVSVRLAEKYKRMFSIRKVGS